MGTPFKMKGSPMQRNFGLQPVDMQKLRAKQARMSKGISEFEHFSNPKSQGDEPIVEGTWGGKKKPGPPKKGPCWEGYEMLGMKKKGGEKVPNCVKKKR